MIKAYALLDSCSKCTWCTEKLIKNLDSSISINKRERE